MNAFRLLHMVARRGNARDFPENSLAALRSAIELGARFIEFDVHLSSDGMPMVVHDRQLVRIANFEELPAAQLARLDAGQPERFGERFRDARIETLATTLGVLERRPELTAFIVIGAACVRRFGRERVISQLVRALQPVRSRCVLGSADLPTIHAARSLAGYPIAWVIPAYDNHTRLKYEALQPDFLFCDRTFLPAAGPLWRGPWRWVVYEADTLEAVLALAARGAHFVGTKDVRSLSEAMRTHASAAAGRDDTPPGDITRW
ncbi:MAG TPA: glycerophosphodiester phosphodiesterase family protein [Steroidobacteraceae bacterium]